MRACSILHFFLSPFARNVTAHRFADGGKSVLALSMVGTVITTAIAPLVAGSNVLPLVLVRGACGLAQSSLYPAWVRQLGHREETIRYSRLFQLYPCRRCVMCSPKCPASPCSSDADGCLQSDVMPDPPSVTVL